MKLLSQVCLSLILSTNLYATNALTTIKFEEGESLNLTLSSLNFNRIEVEGQRIVKVSFPEHSFIVEQNKDDPDDLDGAVVLKPLAHIPLTVYFTTSGNHHFSATIKPADELGKTIKLASKKLKGFDYVKAQEQNQYQNSDLLTSLMEGLAPEGYQELAVKPAPFYLKNHLKVTLVKHYQGKEQGGYVYLVENQSGNRITLNPVLFENPKLLSMEVSKKVLQPLQSAYFYGIYREAPRVG
jgi:conjugal transfer pilus assembly protein TraK